MSPVRRSCEASTAADLALKVEAGSEGGFNLAWPSRPDAATYEVEVFASDGVSVWKKEIKEPRLSLDAAVLPGPRAGLSFLVKVEALDSMRQVVATSALTPLPPQ